jgi:hypothetical protein
LTQGLASRRNALRLYINTFAAIPHAGVVAKLSFFSKAAKMLVQTFFNIIRPESCPFDQPKRKMKKNFSRILVLSACITIFGLLLDSDPKEPSTIMRFVEFFAMLGITFVLCTIGYLTFAFVKRKIQSV